MNQRPLRPERSALSQAELRPVRTYVIPIDPSTPLWYAFQWLGYSIQLTGGALNMPRHYTVSPVLRAGKNVYSATFRDASGNRVTRSFAVLGA